MTGSIEDPSGIQDLLLFRLSKILSIGGSMVTRICEGQYGITRREWALVAQADEMRWSRIIEQSELDNARLSRAVSSLVAKGLALKRQVPSRGVWVSLTESGSLRRTLPRHAGGQPAPPRRTGRGRAQATQFGAGFDPPEGHRTGGRDGSAEGRQAPRQGLSRSPRVYGETGCFEQVLIRALASEVTAASGQASA
jgi:hypothetical protein